MRLRLSLFTKVLRLGLLNLTLLALVFILFARIQFRLDAGSFLLTPAQNRILAMAHTLALELDEKPPAEWGQTLERFSQANRVVLYLLNEEGEHVAGPQLQAPDAVLARIPRRQRPPRGDRPPDQRRPRREYAPKQPAARRGPAPPLFLTATNDPTRYWAGVQIPVRQDRQENPKPGSLILMSTSLISSPLFFDPKPWLSVTLAVVLVSLVCWLPFIRGVTQSISQMRRAAGQIAEGQFEVHVAEGRLDEIGQLGEEINRMAVRLAGFVKGQKRFLGGIAHELCTPIATIQFGLGSLERRVGAEDRDRVADIQEEMQHMSALVNELLSFSRAGIAGVEVKLVEVNVAGVVSRALEREAPSDRQVQSSVDAGLSVWAEPEYLFRAISNLVRNAVRYAGQAGPIEVAARRGEGRVWITVSDHGPGVPEALLDEIFAPFYRVDESRNQETGGVGLGLAIVKSCIEACQGVVRCRNRQPTGLEVEIELKAAGKL